MKNIIQKKSLEASQWLLLLNRLNLSRSEKSTVNRFQNNPTGRVFLPIAEILAKHNLEDEALEILMTGVTFHPRYNAARVMLAEFLFKRSMIEEAWVQLEGSIDSLKDNHLAQNLRLNLAIILAKEFEARETFSYLKRRKMLNAENNELEKDFQSNTFINLRNQYLAKKTAEGLMLSRYSTKVAHEPERISIDSPSASSTSWGKPRYLGSLSNEFLNSLEKRHRMSFLDLGKFGKKNDSSAAVSEPNEIDDFTLAEIYEKHGLNEKALKIYTNILKKLPNNRSINEKIAKLSPLKHIEEPEYQAKVPSSDFATRLFDGREFDRKISYLEQILASL